MSSHKQKSQLPVSSLVIALLVPFIFFGGIGFAINQGWWKTTSSGRTTIALATNLSASGVQGTGLTTELYDPSGIRGNSTFNEIQTHFDLEPELIAQAFGIQSDYPGTITAKVVDEIYGEMVGIEGGVIDIGTDAVKYFVSLMTGIPYDQEENTGLPETAIDIVLTLGPGLTEEQRQAMFRVAGENRTTIIDGVMSSDQSTEALGGAVTTTINEAPFVWQGRTTFGEVMAQGVTLAQIEQVLGLPLSDPGQSVRTFVDANGLQYNQIRTALSALMEE